MAIAATRILELVPRLAAPSVNVWPPLPPDAWLWRPPDRPPFPLESPELRFFALGRQALWHGVGALGLDPGDELIVPDYNHGSEVEALARAGLVPRFHRCNDRLEPPEEELERLVGPATRALYLIHYNGFPQDVPRWRRWCDERGLLLIEDATQAWLAQHDGVPLGSLADLAFFCAYKTYGLPQGALLVSRAPPEPPNGDPGLGLAALARGHGLWLAQRSGAFTALAPRAISRRRDLGERHFELRDLSAPAPSTLAPLLVRLASQDAAAARRANYRLLVRELEGLVPEPFEELPEGAAPFFFPVRSERKAALLERLADRGVEALEVWPVSHPAVPTLDDSAAARRRTTTVGLPVHQELGSAELDRIVEAVAARPPQRPEARLEPVPNLDALGAEWDKLAERAGNLFATREWVSTWWRHYGRGRELAVTACRDGAGGELFAILPLYVASVRPLRALRFLGHGAGDRLGPICASADVERTASALRRLLHGGAGPSWHVLLAEELPADERWAALLHGLRLRSEASPVLRFEWDGFDDFLASRSRNFREQVRRRERKLTREHGLSYRLCEDPEALERDLTILFDLHEARWGEDSDAFDAGRRAFHRDFAATALRRGWLRLWIMELDGRPAAAWYGFRFAGAEWYYQAGRSPAFDRKAAGFVLLSHTIRAAMEEGMQEYKLLRGGEEYKGRFANADSGLETFATGRGAIGTVAAAAASVAAGAPLPPRLRHHLSGLVG